MDALTSKTIPIRCDRFLFFGAAGRRDEALQEQTRLGVTHSQPVIWKFKVSRHYGLLQNVTDVDVPYALKRNKALYRGRLSGIHKVGWDCGGSVRVGRF